MLSLRSFTSNSRQYIVNEIYETLYRIKNMNMQVTFMWFTAHRGLKGNEDVDALAKQALMQEVLCVPHSKSEAKGKIEEHVILQSKIREYLSIEYKSIKGGK